MGGLVCHTGLEPQTSRQGPRQVCYSHVRASPWTGLAGLDRAQAIARAGAAPSSGAALRRQRPPVRAGAGCTMAILALVFTKALPWTSPCGCSTYYGYTSYGCAVCVQVVAYDTENSDMYPPGQGSMVKVPPWQCPSSAPVPPQGAPGGSGQLGTPRERSAHWEPSRCLGCSC